MTTEVSPARKSASPSAAGPASRKGAARKTAARKAAHGVPMTWVGEMVAEDLFLQFKNPQAQFHQFIYELRFCLIFISHHMPFQSSELLHELWTNLNI
jgi:hypothetical protein